tara:strand:+ start:377 stop:613 length:237 start_codon:yes stop_codon:yes gene_type:complete
MENLTPAQRYYQTHKEAKKQYGRDYYYKNRDKILKTIKDKKAPSIDVCVPVASSPLDAYRGRGVHQIENSQNTIVYFN